MGSRRLADVLVPLIVGPLNRHDGEVSQIDLDTQGEVAPYGVFTRWLAE
jgi:hypothetical protein